MKSRFCFISLILALVLTAFIPVPTLAAKPKPFAATGTIDYISSGTVFPAGASVRWVVAERELTGTLSGDLNGQFTMTYKANVESMDSQAGNFHGMLLVGPYILKINGSSEPLEFVGWYAPEVPIYKLIIGGHWTFTNGAHGQGNFDGYAIFIPTPEGHVGYILGSSFNLTGQW